MSNGGRRNGSGKGDFLGRELPHNLEAERALIGCMLTDPQTAIPEAVDILGPEAGDSFWSPRLATVYGVLVHLHRGGEAIDHVLIRQELERRRQWEAIGGYEPITDALGSVGSAARVRDYAMVVREKWVLRRLIGTAHTIAEAGFESRLPMSEVVGDAERRIAELAALRDEKLTREAAWEQIVRETMDEVLTPGRHQGVPTGIVALDQMLTGGGFLPGNLVLIAARPSLGKSALLGGMALDVALGDLADGGPAAFYSLEMQRVELVCRFLAVLSGVNAKAILESGNRPLSKAEMVAVQKAQRDLERRKLIVDDTHGLTLQELRSRMRHAVRRKQARILFVDYLQLITLPGARTREGEVSAISRGLKGIARELNVPVVAAVQLNREPEKANRPPRPSDLRESGSLEQDADVIGLMHRPKAEEPHRIDLILAKQRNGPTGTVELEFVRGHTRFRPWVPSGGEAHGDGSAF